MSRKTSILILGYNRPDLLSLRLIQLAKSRFPVTVSIDGPKSRDNELQNSFRELKRVFSQFNWRFRKENLGIAQHLFTSISEVFIDFDNCVIIEDDIEIEVQSIEAIANLLATRLPSDILTVGAFSALPACWPLEKLIRNKWRKTGYFSAWGWGVQREDWSNFSLELARNVSLDLEEFLRASLGAKRTEIWSRRISAVVRDPKFTWDYQMYLYGLRLQKNHLLPIFRLIDNQGFSDLRATNTKSHKPSWFFGKASKNPPQSNYAWASSRIGQILEILDRATWVSDFQTIKLLIGVKNQIKKFLMG